MENTLLLLSGGIDSMVVLHLLRRSDCDVSAVFVDFGQAALAHERFAASKVASHFGVTITELSFRFPTHFGAGEVRYRNGLLVFAAAMAGGESTESVAIGIHAGVPYADCSPSFLASLEVALNLSRNKPTLLLAPLRTWQKSEIVAFAKHEKLPLDLTYSCESGTMPPCGKCASCHDRALL